MVEIVIPSICNLDVNPLYRQAISESADETKDELKQILKKPIYLLNAYSREIIHYSDWLKESLIYKRIH